MDWIMLRGLTREQAHWGPLPEELATAFTGHTFHCIDLPGTGTRYEQDCPLTIEKITADIRKDLDGLNRPYGIIGVSLGGMVALDWAQKAATGEVAALVLINSSSRLSPFWERMRPHVYPKALAMMVSPDVRAREKRILGLTSNQDVEPDLLADWHNIQRDRPVSVPNGLRQLVAAARFEPATNEPDCPALVLTSRRDRLVNWQCSRDLANHWGWPLKVNDWAGHDLPLDDPEWIVDQLRSFMVENEIYETVAEPSLRAI